ncbi:MAG: sigma-70 family RNA polymerase sigma factor [Candidatus Pseudobacter hemicellulosilyticus]|uniref:Sigma-70 family RNA polymerase sigma factor n=1 Tax=Candidatus Pseudobacter hemicellulosilyticus TaxID=3121375 RepID=A0AAJ5WPC7_9BACT|nr:MAG: sigma-70 family RNA polymerase sigma factor [Pseudobacter sp.]
MGSVYDDNEARLVADVKSGEKGAIARLYELFYDPLVGFTRQITGDNKEAEDIISNTFIKLMNKNRHFNTLKNIKSFLYVTAHNAAVDFLRSAKRQEQVQREMAYLSDTLLYPDHDFLQVKTEAIVSVCREMDILPRQCREVFDQFFFRQRTTREIAQDLNIKDVTVRRQKQIALDMLRAALQKKTELHQ